MTPRVVIHCWHKRFRLNSLVFSAILLGSCLTAPFGLSFSSHSILAPSKAGASTVVHEISVGRTPAGISVDSATNLIYVANEGATSVSVITGASNTVIYTINTIPNPIGVRADAATDIIYVTSSYSNSVIVITGKYGTKQAAIPVGTDPIAVTVDEKTNVIYTANYISNSVSVITGFTYTRISTIYVGTYPVSLCSDDFLNKIYVADSGSTAVSVVTGITKKLTKTIPLTGAGAAGLIRVNGTTHNVYLADFYSSNVSVISGITLDVTATVHVPYTAPGSVAIDTTDNLIYVGCDTSLVVINGSSNTVVSATANIGFTPHYLTVDTSSRRVYAVNETASQVLLVTAIANLTTSRISTSLTTFRGGTPHTAIAVDAYHHTAYVSNTGSTEIAAITESSHSLSGLISVSPGPTRLADPIAIGVSLSPYLIYVADYASSSVSVITGTSKAVTESIAIGGGTNPSELAVNTITGEVYVVSNTPKPTITQVEPLTPLHPTVTDSESFTYRVSSIAFNSLNSDIYLSLPTLHQVWVLTSASLVKISAITVCTFPNALTIDSSTDQIYASNGATISVITGLHGDVTKTLQPGGSTNYEVVNSQTHVLYVSQTTNRHIVAITGTSGTVLYSVPTNTYTFIATFPGAIAIDQTSNTVYAALTWSQDIFSIVSATKPHSPSLLSVIHGNASAILRWSAPSNTGGMPISTYEACWSTNELTATSCLNRKFFSSSTSGIVPMLTNGTSYYFVLRAKNLYGYSPFTPPQVATPSTVPAAPAFVSSSSTTSTVSLHWNTPTSNGAPVSGYLLCWSQRSATVTACTNKKSIGTATSTSISSLLSGTKYYFALRAKNLNGFSSFSSQLTQSTLTVPSAPTLSKATKGNGSVSLTWVAPTNNGGSSISGYLVCWATASATVTSCSHSHAFGVVSSGSISSLSNGTTYYFAVKAANSAGYSPLSGVKSASPASTTPTAPSLLTAATSSGKVTLQWRAPVTDGGTAVVGYKVCWSSSSTGAASCTHYKVVGSVTTASVSGLSNSTLYYFVVKARNGHGYGSASNQLSAMP